MGGQTLFTSGVRTAAVGGLVWLALLVCVLLNSLPLSTFDLLFLLAPLVVVPLTLRLVPTVQDGPLFGISGRVIRYSLLPGAMATTASFLLPVGRVAGLFNCLWLIVGAALALDGLIRLIRTRVQSLQEFCFAVGEGYSLIGALWLLATRLGLKPLSFHEPIVLLTAIHFHYAGLMAAVLAGLAVSYTPTPLVLRIALSCGVLGPGLLGLAFLAGPKLKLAAVTVMVVGECGIAVATFRRGLADAARIGGRMLLVGSVCVIFGMALAGAWAVGEYPLYTFVNLEQMACYHGVLNSVGFGLCSLAGWILLRRTTKVSLERM